MTTEAQQPNIDYPIVDLVTLGLQSDGLGGVKMVVTLADWLEIVRTDEAVEWLGMAATQLGHEIERLRLRDHMGRVRREGDEG